jgi:tripartite-type tricarboxylate transporter receptor subunit TctC
MAARPGLVRDFNADIHRRLSRTDSERPLKPQEAQEAFEPEGEAMLTRLIAAALAVVVLTPLHPLNAQDWPARTVTMVVPFPAGGPLDVVARILAQPMGELLGQQIIIENIGGAGGSTGSSRVAKAAPDGYVFLYGNSGTHAYSQLLTKKPPYDAVNDFAPVAVFVENSKVLVTRKDLPADTLGEFIAYAKANQARMQYGSAGGGSATHVSCVLLNVAIGVDVTHVPYRGTGPAMHRLYL